MALFHSLTRRHVIRIVYRENLHRGWGQGPELQCLLKLRRRLRTSDYIS